MEIYIIKTKMHSIINLNQTAKKKKSNQYEKCGFNVSI